MWLFSILKNRKFMKFKCLKGQYHFFQVYLLLFLLLLRLRLSIVLTVAVNITPVTLNDLKLWNFFVF